MICKNEKVSKVLHVCTLNRDKIRESIGAQIHSAEHVIYGVTYLLIGFTHIDALYYAFGTFVLFAIVFGKE